ncbi:fungal-specific transcription factor domain-containing protein [Chaetomium fimeti]|uniref:Fungal-specific transcription factor domain-containing protein n=1 Tax=Chaetomium fimeti TaxID=1854472 RepID=A0AAE0LTM2_9PEZI|nr:fungal-specific transcription factor domain-containing protein [Chaetomium fimeti]
MDASTTPASEATTSQASTPVPNNDNHNNNNRPNTASNSGIPIHGKPPRRILACELCQHRKIKCDRHFPCANCTKVRTMRKMMDDEDSYEASPESMTTDDNTEMLLGGDSPEVDLANLWPSPAQILPLWQVYLDRVNPLTKIIHVPSVQPYMAAVITDSKALPRNVEALLFSIFVMAVVAMTPDECKALLGIAREEALQRYSSGVRLTLVRVGFLRSHDMIILQALVIYLISLQGRYDRHAVWILGGVAIRIAQKMGLHRDGATLGLSPFESEMRRRLWWQIIMTDAKYAMFSGLSHNLLPRNSDTKSPSNVNDADIFPTSEEPFQDRDGPTEMIFCLITYRFAKFLMEMPGFEGVVMIPEDESMSTGKGAPTAEQLATYRRGVAQLREDLKEILDKHCDSSAGPVHAMALEMKKHLFMKLEELMTPPKEQLDWGGEVKSASDNTFKIAIGTLEHNEANYNSTSNRGFAWFSLLHFQLDIFMYMAGQLCRRTEGSLVSGSLVERAWRQVDVVYSFHPELFDMTNKNYMTLAVYVLQAWKMREQLVLAKTGQPAQVPFYVDKLRLCLPDVECKVEAAQPTPPIPFDAPEFAPAEPLDFAMDPHASLDDYWQMDWGFGTQPANLDSAGMGVSGLGPFAMAPLPEW